MRLVQRAAAGAGVFALALSMTACATSAQDAATRVGVAMPTTGSPRWIADGENVKAQLEDLGHLVDLQYAEDDVPTQVAQLEQMIADGADILVVAAIDGTALKGVLAEAASSDIPVISYDRLIRDSSDVDYYATFDNALVGVQQANSLLLGLGVVDATGKATGVTGPFNIELIAGSPDDNNATVFYNGAMSILQPYLDNGTLVVRSGETDFDVIATPAWNGETAATRLSALLSTYYADGQLAAILSPADIISVPLIDTLTAAGYGTGSQAWPIVTGQDADIAAVQAVRDGQLYSTVYKDTRQLAEVAVTMVDAILQGEAPETNDVTSYDNGVIVVPSYLLKSQVVTTDNYEEVLIESGYYTSEELA